MPDRLGRCRPPKTNPGDNFYMQSPFCEERPRYVFNEVFISTLPR